MASPQVPLQRLQRASLSGNGSAIISSLRPLRWGHVALLGWMVHGEASPSATSTCALRDMGQSGPRLFLVPRWSARAGGGSLRRRGAKRGACFSCSPPVRSRRAWPVARGRVFLLFFAGPVAARATVSREGGEFTDVVFAFCVLSLCSAQQTDCRTP